MTHRGTQRKITNLVPNPKPTTNVSPNLKKIHPKVNLTLPKKISTLNSISKFGSFKLIQFQFLQGTCWCSPPHFHCWDPGSPSKISESNPWNPPCWSGRPWWNDPSNDNTTWRPTGCNRQERERDFPTPYGKNKWIMGDIYIYSGYERWEEFGWPFVVAFLCNFTSGTSRKRPAGSHPNQSHPTGNGAWWRSMIIP